VTSSGTSATAPSSSLTGSSGGVPPPGTAACASPLVTPAGTLTAPGQQRYFFLSANAHANEAAVVYGQSPDGLTWPVKLQRLSPVGNLVGTPVPLGEAHTAAVGDSLQTTVATEGTRHLACWDGSGENRERVACAWVPSVAGGAVGGLGVEGSLPALSRGPQGFRLAWANGTSVLTQGLSDTAQARGDPVVATPAGSHVLRLVSSPSGFHVVVDRDGLTLQGLDPAGQPVGNPVVIPDTGSPREVGVAAAGEEVLVAWRRPDGHTVARVVAPDASLSAEIVLAEAAHQSARVSATAGLGSFGVTWPADSSTVSWRSLDAAGAPLGPATNAGDTLGDDNPHALTAVSDGFLLVTTQGLTYKTMQVLHLRCP
jgi:hypothetical protein